VLVFGENPAWRGRRILLMKKKRFSVEQIVGVLKQAEVGVPVVELLRAELSEKLHVYRTASDPLITDHWFDVVCSKYQPGYLESRYPSNQPKTLSQISAFP
jgi:hypothetical protein